jgi:outer membrane protein assembly factor BamB
MLRELGLGDGALETATASPPARLVPTEPEPVPYTESAGELPPVRRGEGATLGPEIPRTPPSPSTAPAAEREAPRTKRRRSLVVMLLLLTLVGGVSWAWLHFAGIGTSGNEGELYAKALKAYDERDFSEAASFFRDLYLKYPQSSKVTEYRFLAEFSDIREAVHRIQPNPEKTKESLERLARFVGEYKDDPLLAKRHPDLHESFKRLAEELKEVSKQTLTRNWLQLAERVYDLLPRYGSPPPPPVRDELAQIGRDIARKERRERVLASLDSTLKKPSADRIRNALALVAEANVGNDPEVKQRRDQLAEAHRATIRYTAALDADAQDPPNEDRVPSLLVTPPLAYRRVESLSGQPPVLAQARGVLHALEPDNGHVRWAVRVSPEAVALPLWLPRTTLAPEQVLVLSPDSLTLSALDARTGATRWSRRLSMPCLAQPVRVGDRVFVPGYGGRVEEIEVNSGALRGYYDLGQPLTVGGVWQPGTSLVYFPAESFCVYVLDVDRHTCSAVFYTGHPASSLLSTPVILPGPTRPAAEGKSASGGGYLLLAQASGLDAMKLRAFALPASQAEAAPVQEVELAGWAWFPPWTDGETLAVITDAGDFRLFGVEPRSDRSAPLFPRFKTAIPPGAHAESGQARAQLVHATDGRFWALAHGGLHRLQTAFTRDQGAHLDPPGPALLGIGSPLHAAQVRASSDGTTIYLVTQRGDGQTSLVTAVDSRGEERWRRLLGLACRDQPVAVGERVLAQDLAGRLFLFDASKARPQDGQAWCQGGERVGDRAPTGGGPSYFLRGRDGTVYAVTTVQRVAGSALRVRAFPPGKPPGEPTEIPLYEPLAGRPAVVGNGLVLLLANGVPVWQPLAGGTPLNGPNWRAALADKGAAGHVVALGGDEFLMTDGSRGLRRMSCDGKVWEKRAEKTLENRIVSAPAVLKTDGGSVRVGVADRANVVTLLEGDGLEVLRTWRLSGAITAGPFVRGGGFVCVVDRRTVVWLDPEQKHPRWTADFRADVVGRPQLIDGVLVVADQRGQIQALDPATGKTTGPGYTLQASAAPTASPIPFGADRLFVPLTDGTVLLPGRKCLRPPQSSP